MTFLGIVLHKWKRHSCLALFSKTAFDKKKQKKTQLYVTLTACIQNIHILFLKCEVSFSVVTYSRHRDSLTVWRCESVTVLHGQMCSQHWNVMRSRGESDRQLRHYISHWPGRRGRHHIDPRVSPPARALTSHLSPLTSHLSPLTHHREII